MVAFPSTNLAAHGQMFATTTRHPSKVVSVDKEEQNKLTDYYNLQMHKIILSAS